VGDLFPITEATAEKLRIAFNAGNWNALRDIRKFILPVCENCREDNGRVLKDSFPFDSLRIFFNSFYDTIGIEDESTRSNLHSSLIDGHLSEWRDLVANAYEVTFRKLKKREKTRGAALGVYLSVPLRLDPMEVLFMFLQAAI